MEGKLVAAKLKVSETTVSNWTNGRYHPRRRHATKLAGIFGVSPESFLLSRPNDDETVSLTDTAEPSTAVGAAESTVDSHQLTADEIVSALAAIDPQPAMTAISAVARQIEDVLRDAKAYVARER